MALSVADTRAIDIQLATGDVSEVVNVEVAAVAVKTVGADVSGLVTGQEARALPLNGRNFMQLTLLQPGVSGIDGLTTIDKGLGSGSDISVSGGSVTNNYWMVDGANNIDLGSGRTILVTLRVLHRGFKIQRNNWGRVRRPAGAGQHRDRGGPNDFHGRGYWYGRRDP